MKILFTGILLCLLTAATSSCYYDKADLLYPNSSASCDTITTARFSADVLAVFGTSCNMSGCHNTASASSGVILDTYAGVKAAADNGRLMGSINQTSGYSPMPKGSGKLNTCSIRRIQQWINAGTPNN